MGITETLIGESEAWGDVDEGVGEFPTPSQIRALPPLRTRPCLLRGLPPHTMSHRHCIRHRGDKGRQCRPGRAPAVLPAGNVSTAHEIEVSVAQFTDFDVRFKLPLMRQSGLTVDGGMISRDAFGGCDGGHELSDLAA